MKARSSARKGKKRVQPAEPDGVIRRAGFEDAETIFAMVKRHPEELVPRPLSDIVQNIDRFLVCETGGELVGIVSWQILPEIGAARHPTVEIKSLAVRQDRRGTGVGYRLVTAAIRSIRSLHPSQIIALTFRPEFFRRLGFREVPKESLMHKIYIGCINCAKYDSPFTCPEVAMALQLDG
jgi:amino-acid N-acetyltransferase